MSERNKVHAEIFTTLIEVAEAQQRQIKAISSTLGAQNRALSAMSFTLNETIKRLEQVNEKLTSHLEESNADKSWD